MPGQSQIFLSKKGSISYAVPKTDRNKFAYVGTAGLRILTSTSYGQPNLPGFDKKIWRENNAAMRPRVGPNFIKLAMSGDASEGLGGGLLEDLKAI